MHKVQSNSLKIDLGQLKHFGLNPDHWDVGQVYFQLNKLTITLNHVDDPEMTLVGDFCNEGSSYKIDGLSFAF